MEWQFIYSPIYNNPNMDKIYGLTISPMISISYCLERVSRMQHKERNPQQR